MDFDKRYILRQGWDLNDFTISKTSYGLRYNELISPMIKAIQEQVSVLARRSDFIGEEWLGRKRKQKRNGYRKLTEAVLEYLKNYLPIYDRSNLET